MDVYYGGFNMLYQDKVKMEFNIIGYPERYMFALDSLKNKMPVYIGNIEEIEDQLLYKNIVAGETFYIYVRDGKIYGVIITPDIQCELQSDVDAFLLEIDRKTEEVYFKQTSPLGYAAFDAKGNLIYSFNELLSEGTDLLYIPYDLGLTTVEYRYLQMGHVQYENHHQYICYDLFRKEFILTKKMIEVIYNNANVVLDFSESETINFDAVGKSSSISLLRFPAGRGSRVFHPIKELMENDQHIHSIIEIDGQIYYLYNRLSGIFLMRGYPTRVSGFRSSMFSFFGIKNLYIVGRNTHYAFQANGKYEKLFIEENHVSTFVRPLKVKLFQRFGYFKIPLKSIEENLQSENGFYIGNSIPLHPMKIKTKNPRKNISLDMKNRNGETYKLGVNAIRNLVIQREEHKSKFVPFKRIGRLIEQLIPTKLMTKIEKINKRLRLKLEKMTFNILGALPKKEKLVVFESFHGKQFSDNPRAIYEYMKKEKPDYNLLWSIEPDSVKLFESFEVPYIKRGSLKWFLTYPRAKYWINNARLPNWIKKPANTVYLQTWHGTPLKKLGFDIEEVYMPGTNTMTYQNNFANEAKNWDFLVSPNAYSTEIFKRAFRYDGKVIESGYPRNDALQNVDMESTQRIRETIGIAPDKKIILYAPTWRDDNFYKRGQYKFEFQFDLRRFKERYGDNFVLLTRMHYLVAENFDFSKYEGFIYDVSSYPDIKDLYRISDLLITDYSSVFFDYSILNRPIIFYMYDLEKYRDQLRGFYFDIEKEAPGPIAETEEELFTAIDKTIDPSWSNPNTFGAFQEKFTAWEDGQAAKKVVAAMIAENEK